jgi:hypothetical protein
LDLLEVELDSWGFEVGEEESLILIIGNLVSLESEVVDSWKDIK